MTTTSSMRVPGTTDSVSFLFFDDDGADGAFISMRYGGPGREDEPLSVAPDAD